MKVLVFLSILAAATAAPTRITTHHVVNPFPHHAVVNPLTYSSLNPWAFTSASHVSHPFTFSNSLGSSVMTYGATGAHGSVAYHATPINYNAAIANVVPLTTRVSNAVPFVFNTQHIAAAPVVQSYSAVSTPVVAVSHAHAAGAVVSTYNHPVVTPFVTQNVAVAVQPAVVATAPATLAVVPAAVTYESHHTVALPPKEVIIPVQNTVVEIPVVKRIQYGVENFVAGSTIAIHKPQLSAPVISAPRILKPITRYAAPEVTVHHTEVNAHKTTPVFVDAHYDAGTVVEYTAPEINQVDVAIPVEVHKPVVVPHPVAVPVAQPVLVKSSVTPVVNIDYHHIVQDETVVAPVHHIAAVSAVAPTVYAGQVSQSLLTYNAAGPIQQQLVSTQNIVLPSAIQYSAPAAQFVASTHHTGFGGTNIVNIGGAAIHPVAVHGTTTGHVVPAVPTTYSAGVTTTGHVVPVGTVSAGHTVFQPFVAAPAATVWDSANLSGFQDDHIGIHEIGITAGN